MSEINHNTHYTLVEEHFKNKLEFYLIRQGFRKHYKSLIKNATGEMSG